MKRIYFCLLIIISMIFSLFFMQCGPAEDPPGFSIESINTSGGRNQPVNNNFQKTEKKEVEKKLLFDWNKILNDSTIVSK